MQLSLCPVDNRFKCSVPKHGCNFESPCFIVKNNWLSTVWSDGLFDENLLKSLVQTIDCHFSVEPNSNGRVHLSGDFTLFAPNIPNSGGLHPQTPNTQ